MLVASLLAIHLAAQVSGLDALGQDLARLWGPGSPNRSLRVACTFTLKVEQADPAMGDEYFPNMATPRGAIPRSRWVEDFTGRGEKFRVQTEFFAEGKGKAATGASSSVRLFNGRHSWSYRPGGTEAEQFDGIDPTTRPTLGYYGEFIGVALRSGKTTRLMAGDLGEPFQIDELIPSGKYAIAGEETLDGEPCVILERRGLDRLWLAKEKGWAIVRREWCWTEGGPLKRRVINQDFRPVGGVWLPFKGRMAIFGHPASKPGKEVGVLEAVVREAEVDVPDERFEPDFPPGTLIVNGANGDRFLLGVETDSVDPKTVQSLRLQSGFRPAPWWWTTTAWVILGVPLFAGLAYWVYQRFR